MDEAVGSSEVPAFLLCGVLSRDGPPCCQSPLCGSTPNRAERLLSFLEAVLSLRLSCAPLFSRRCSLTDPHTHPNKTIHPHIPHASDINCQLRHYQGQAWPLERTSAPDQQPAKVLVYFGRQSANAKEALCHQSPYWFTTSGQSQSDQM